MIDVDGQLTSSLAGKSFIGTKRGEFDWSFQFSDKAFMSTEGPWRILCNGRIALGSNDHAQKFGLSEPVDGVVECHHLLDKKRVLEICVRQDTGDLTVKFTQDTILEILNISSGYEGWSLGDGAGLLAVATGGGKLALWSNGSNGVDWKDYRPSSDDDDSGNSQIQS